jgi:uncharacterized protein (UPF0548 family)
VFFIRKPNEKDAEQFLAAQRQSHFSYSEVGITRKLKPEYRDRDHFVDHNQTQVGVGSDIFASSVAGLRTWQMFRLGWIDLFPQNVSIEAGQTVALRIHHFGFWSLNACRVVYTIKETHRFGFGYGTLDEHAESGEERFIVEMRPDGSVWFEILAISQPRLLARIGTPLVRSLQKRFARDAMAAMQEFIHAAR